MGLESGTASSIVSCSACVSELTAELNSLLLLSSLGIGWSARFAVSRSLNSSQSVMRKFLYGTIGLWAAWISMVVRIGTWSVPGPHSWRLVSQLVISSNRLSVQKTLSTLVQFPVTIDCSVGSFLGSDMVML